MRRQQRGGKLDEGFRIEIPKRNRDAKCDEHPDDRGEWQNRKRWRLFVVASPADCNIQNDRGEKPDNETLDYFESGVSVIGYAAVSDDKARQARQHQKRYSIECASIVTQQHRDGADQGGAKSCVTAGAADGGADRCMYQDDSRELHRDDRRDGKQNAGYKSHREMPLAAIGKQGSNQRCAYQRHSQVAEACQYLYPHGENHTRVTSRLSPFTRRSKSCRNRSAIWSGWKRDAVSMPASSISGV